MKRELFVHFAFWLSFFVFITVAKNHFNLGYWPFWLGGVVGIFLPDLDHLLYVLFLKPEELTSQRVGSLVGKKAVWRAIQLLYETRNERRGLIFHTVLFQVIFLALTFWMISSSVSLFGRGLVLSFSLHLCIDQIVDLMETGVFTNWLKDSPIMLNPPQVKTYWAITTILTVGMGFLS